MRNYAPFVLALGALIAAFGGCSSPEADARSVVQGACAALRGEVPYDVTYTVSFANSDGAETVSTWDVRVNENGEYHAVIAPYPTIPGYPPAAYRGTAEMISVGDAIYFRSRMDDEPFDAWQVSEILPTRDICTYVDAPGLEGAVYTDLGSTMLDGAEARRIRYETSVESDVLVEEYWVTPAGEIKQYRIDGILGELTTSWLGVISGVGEPNIVTRPALPTPSPTLDTETR